MNLSRTLTQGEINLESIKCPRKSDLTLTFTYKTSAGVGIDISTATAFTFTVKDRITGLRSFQKTLGSGIALSGGGTGGIFVVTITGTNNTLTFGDYDYDQDMTLGGAFYTLARGTYRMWDIVSDAATS